MTKIEWTHIFGPGSGKSWNPFTGCTHVSEACDNCYARELHNRRHKAYLAGKQVPPCYAEPFDKVVFHENRLEQPLHWRKSSGIFVCSMGDLGHEDIPFEQLDRAFAVMALCPQHTFQLLTKRPERMREYLTSRLTADGWAASLGAAAYMSMGYSDEAECAVCNAICNVLAEGNNVGWPMRNVWLGVTAENQEQADKRIPILLDTPAAVRFVSMEPMLDAIDLTEIQEGATDTRMSRRDVLRGIRFSGSYISSTFPHLDWVICGGETGPGARPMNPDWARSLRDQCKAAGVPFFFKQWGSAPYWADDPGEWVEAGCDPANWRDGGNLLDAVVWQEFPEVRRA